MAHHVHGPMSVARLATPIALAGCILWPGGSALAEGPAARAAEPKELYAAHCLACHQADGQGVPFMQPPLVGGAWVKSDPETLALFVLTGGFNSAERKNSRNANVMPSFVALDDQTLAAILTYVRATFGGDAGPVSPLDVAAARRRVPP
jgi:mono/diheme cytochrome c family protein